MSSLPVDDESPLTPTVVPKDPDVEALESEYTSVDEREFGRYDLLIEMGSGGMATLYLARLRGPEEFEKLLAIKKIHPHLAKQPSFVRMFLDEARIAALIHHPNVVSTFDMGNIGKAYFMAMEYVHGQNLTDVIKASIRDHEAFPWPHAVRIIADAAAGLHAAHELTNARGKPLSVVHRDVSPHNILVSYDGSVKVVDFGIAFASEKLEQTAVGTVKGKAGYMSPEQAMGEPLDRRSDIFSLGTVLWECVCRRRLFRKESDGATILSVREAEVPPMQLRRPGIPAELDRIVHKALAKKVEDRYQTMEELSEALVRLLGQTGEVVQRRHVGRTVSALFADRRKLKDEQIQKALEGAQAAPLTGIGMGDTRSLARRLTDEATVGATGPGRRRRGLAIWAGVIVALAALVLVGVLWNPFRSREEQSHTAKGPPAQPMARPPKAPKPRRKAPPARVRLIVKVLPATAPVVVEFRGRQQEGARFAIEIPPSTRTETIRVQAKGYVTQSVTVVPSNNLTVPVTLQKVAEAPMTVRRRRRRRRRRPGYRPRPRRRAQNMLRDLPD